MKILRLTVMSQPTAKFKGRQEHYANSPQALYYLLKLSEVKKHHQIQKHKELNSLLVS